MGERSFIVRGNQDRDALHFCSHGAGRNQSQASPGPSISVDSHRSHTTGVFCDKTSAVIDESSQAYKSIDSVMSAQKNLVEIEYTLKGFINVKGLGEEKKT